MLRVRGAITIAPHNAPASAPPTWPPTEIRGKTNVSTRFMISSVPTEVLSGLAPCSQYPTNASAIRPNTAPDAPPAIASPSISRLPAEPPRRQAKYTNRNRIRPKAGSSI